MRVQGGRPPCRIPKAAPLVGFGAKPQEEGGRMAKLVYDENGRLMFTKEMRKENYTILVPMMAKIHFKIMTNVFVHYGYNCVLLDTEGPEIAQVGLKYVHNDTCYPALLVIGQMIHALQSGKYDTNKTALMITQTGGGCRASNYIHLLRKALVKAGFENVPVISLNMSGLEKNSGFSLTIPMIRRVAAGLIYGDMIMALDNQTKPYEINRGESQEMVDKWVNKLTQTLADGHGFTKKEIAENLDGIASDFSKIKINKVPKVKVGIVGEIYVKYSALGNNDLEQFLYDQDCEVNLPGILGFALFKVDNRMEDIKLYGGSKAKFIVVKKLFNYLIGLEELIINSQKKYGFRPNGTYAHTNIVCTQPFGCLPNHINGKGMIRPIKMVDERANIVAIDYDPGAPKVNQENRIKLMLAVAKEQLAKNIQNNEKIN